MPEIDEHHGGGLLLSERRTRLTPLTRKVQGKPTPYAMTGRRSDSGRFDFGAAYLADLKIGQVQQPPPAGQFAMI